MALHPDFPHSPYAILDPGVRWFPADEALRESSMDKLMPPLVSQLRKKVQAFRNGGYAGVTDTSKSLLTWWFKEPHLLERADGSMASFRYFFAQREALETIVYLYDAAKAKDKYDLMRFDRAMTFKTVAYQQFTQEEQREIVFKDITTGEVTHTTTLDSAGVADYRSVIGYLPRLS